MKIQDVAEPIEATRANLSGSTFVKVNLSGAAFSDVNLSSVTIDNVKLTDSRWNNVNLSGLRITDANLSHASIAQSCTHGMTIDGIAIEDLMAAYRAANPKS
jgi:uncharacterized protein YjbI with pentapeptide repeats